MNSSNIKLEKFRHISNLELNFINPISVITGTNRSGKSTILMAIACSHFNFKKRNPKNGALTRHTWSSLMKFTSYDKQIEDWTYFISYQIGDKSEIKRGRRKMITKKWSGIGKKESQFKDRDLIFIDLDRTVPARFYGDKIYRMSRNTSLKELSNDNVATIEGYLSDILETSIQLKKLATHLDKSVYQYGNTHQYSSYNAASGEEILTSIIIDLVEAPKKSLILIDEIEIGLHPKVQRKLIDVIRNISRKDEKQFILTTHSSTILSAVDSKSRIFIERSFDDNYKAIAEVSVNAALSKMDSESFPLLDIFCEDEMSEKIIKKGITKVGEQNNLNNFDKLINIVISNGAQNAYSDFTSHQRTYKSKKIKSGYACILDGDMRGDKSFKPDNNLHFLYSDEAPENFLTRAYLNENPNEKIEYHLKSTNSHYLFNEIVNNSAFSSNDDVFNCCWGIFVNTTEGEKYFQSLQNFLLQMTKKYSPEL